MMSLSATGAKRERSQGAVHRLVGYGGATAACRDLPLSMPCLGSYSHCFDYTLNCDMSQVPQGQVLASQDSSVQAGEAERQESTDRVRGAQEFRWKQLSAFEGKHHSSLERVFEVAAQTTEESQPQRDLLKEAVPLAAPKVCRPQRPAHRGLEKLLQEFSRQGHALSQVCREKAVLAQENAALEARLAATERDLRGVSEQLAEASLTWDFQNSRLLHGNVVSRVLMLQLKMEGHAEKKS
ncbi:uncharacterized protein LOC128822418 [Vidua macroura]|uniref:uncharacterized protein LOC128822418 n=1 Tax=Vidua macroura TaxID=187451 RepID=UPI0023A81E06|nr:uncharacterized protein LOC128822418 [Vidua macroura]